MTRRVAALLIGLLSLGITVAACSGSSTDQAGSASPPSTGRPTPKTDPGDDAQRYRDAVTAAGRADDLLGSGDCIQTGAAFSALIAEPTALAAGGASSDRIDQFKADIESLKKQVPEQLAGDMNTLADAYETAATELAGFGTLGTTADRQDLLQKTQDAQDTLQRLRDPKVTEAEQHLSAYFRDCETKIAR